MRALSRWLLSPRQLALMLFLAALGTLVVHSMLPGDPNVLGQQLLRAQSASGTSAGAPTSALARRDVAADAKVWPSMDMPLDDYPRVTWTCVSRRPEFREAVRAMFTAQTWPNRELVFVANYADNATRADANADGVSEQRISEQELLMEIHALPAKLIGYGLNLAIARSTGDYWFKVDDDDFYAPDYTAEMMEHLARHPLVGMTYSYIYLKRYNMTIRGGIHQTPPLDDEESSHVFGSTMSAWMSLVKRHRFDEALVLGEDSEWLGRLAREFAIRPFRLAWGSHVIVRGHAVGHTWTWPPVGFLGELVGAGMVTRGLDAASPPETAPPWLFHFTATHEDHTGITVLLHMRTCQALNVKYALRNFGRTRFYQKDIWVLVEPRLPHDDQRCNHHTLYNQLVPFLLSHDPRVPVGAADLDEDAWENDDLCDVWRRVVLERGAALMLPYVTLGSADHYWGRDFFSLFGAARETMLSDWGRERFHWTSFVSLREHDEAAPRDAVVEIELADGSIAFTPRNTSAISDDLIQRSTLILLSSHLPTYCSHPGRAAVVESCGNTNDTRPMTRTIGTDQSVTGGGGGGCSGGDGSKPRPRATALDGLPRGGTLMRWMEFYAGGQKSREYRMYERSAARNSADGGASLARHTVFTRNWQIFSLAALGLAAEAVCIYRFWLWVCARLSPLAVDSD